MKFIRVWTCARGHQRVYKVDNDKPFCPLCDEKMSKADINALPALNSKAEVEVEMMEVEDPNTPVVEVYNDRITEPATKLIPKPEWKGERGFPGGKKYKEAKKAKKPLFDEDTQTFKRGRGRPTRAEAEAQGKVQKWGRPKKNDKTGAK